MAMPPFDTMQQSSRCSGRATQREDWWSASVIGSRNRASGFFAAHARCPTAIAPSCSLVVPKRFMWRWAARAYPLLGFRGPATAASPPNPVATFPGARR